MAAFSAKVALTALRPGIWIKQIDPGNAGVRQAVNDVDGVAAMQADVFQAAPLDQRQQARHAVNEGFASDETHVGLEGGRLDQMLAAAKADLEPCFANRGAKQRRRIDGLGEIESQPGQ